MLKDAIARLLLIRADGGSQIGFGHVMRSMALAEEWIARGGQCVWVTNQPRSLDAAGTGRDDMEVITIDAETGGAADAGATRKLAESTRADWVLTDLFAFKPEYFSTAGSRGTKWLLAHDESLRVNDRINAILNPGPHAASAMYPGFGTKCGLLLGLDYALVRSEIRTRNVHRTDKRNPPAQILITFGGSDPADFTWRTLSALAAALAVSSARFRVILGPGYRGECAERGGVFKNIDVEFVRYTSNMGAHYAWADLIVCGASTTLWEAFFFGLPAVVLPIARNQRMVFDALVANPAAVRFEEPNGAFGKWMASALAGEAEARQWLAHAAEAAPKLVDGKGASRVVDYLLSVK